MGGEAGVLEPGAQPLPQLGAAPGWRGLDHRPPHRGARGARPPRPRRLPRGPGGRGLEVSGGLLLVPRPEHSD